MGLKGGFSGFPGVCVGICADSAPARAPAREPRVRGRTAPSGELLAGGPRRGRGDR